MFTGLVEEIGIVRARDTTGAGTRLRVAAPLISAHLSNGDSVAVNGCCLTVTAHDRDELTFDLLEETLARTNLRTAQRDSIVNLERALLADGRIGGHFVQGHIDCTARVRAFDRSGADHRIEVELPREFAQYAVFKGSVALNGISLTIAEVLAESFVVWIIPHTMQHTNLQSVAPGDLLNVEFDLLAKYVERMLERQASRV
jgi:riboflavin synthase